MVINTTFSRRGDERHSDRLWSWRGEGPSEASAQLTLVLEWPRAWTQAGHPLSLNHSPANEASCPGGASKASGTAQALSHK